MLGESVGNLDGSFVGCFVGSFVGTSVNIIGMTFPCYHRLEYLLIKINYPFIFMRKICVKLFDTN